MSEPTAPLPHGSALCAIGDGIGNIIEQSMMVQAAITLYDHVDVWTPRTTAANASVIADLPGIRNLICDRGYFRQARLDGRDVHYDAVFPTFLIQPKFYKQVPTFKRYLSPHPNGNPRGEGLVMMQGIRAAGFRDPTPHPWCGYYDIPDAALDDLPRAPLIGISAGGNARPVWRHKRYQQYADVVTCIQSKMDANFVLFGVDTDDPIPHPDVIDFRGRHTLRHTCGFIRRCDLFLANDCGLAHAAAALGVPTVIVFGPTVIGKNRPPGDTTVVRTTNLKCQPCQYRGGVGRYPSREHCNNECMTALQPSTVADAVLRELKPCSTSP